MIFAGIDEAGYGPTLGPLVVCVAVFRVPDPERPAPGADAPAPNLWTTLADAVSRRPEPRKIAVDDSKKLYQPRRGLRTLEEGVLPFLCAGGKSLPGDLRALLGRVVATGGAPADAYLERYPWYAGRNVSIPRDGYTGAIRSRAEALTAALEAAGVEFLGLAATPIAAGELNRALASSESKAAVSFEAIAAFLRGIWKRYPQESADVWVDRQGGRIRYGPQVFAAVHPRSIRIDSQQPEASIYALQRREDPSGRLPYYVRFVREAEQDCLPVALASMLAKYTRELHMHMFNEFWSAHVEGLKPTAGYAVDGRRFLDDIAAARQRLAVADELLVRQR